MRTYKRTTERGNTPKDFLEKACHAVIFDKKSVNATSKQYGIPYKTLHRYVIKLKQKLECNNLTKAELTLDTVGYVKNRQVFTNLEEAALASYLKKAADIYYGLTRHETRKLAYQFAKKHNKVMPGSWRTKLLAGEDWLDSFLKRHTSLSIRSPQATRLSRATSFNKYNVSLFFATLTAVYQRLNLNPGDIWNVNETGFTTAHIPNRVIARCGKNNVGKMTTAEKGTLVTVAVAISALGNMVPPFFVFPRIHYKSYFIKGGSVGSEGDANPSGWMKEENFVKYAKHFVQHVKSSKEKPVLLLLDNHDSHLSIEVLDYFKDNGVTVLSFPPHCSHKLQPLDRSVYGPLKKYFNRASDNWLANNPGKTLTVYDIPGLLKTSLPLAATIENIRSGFRVTGISPLNENVFPESEFGGAYVTDRPMPTNKDAVAILSTSNIRPPGTLSTEIQELTDSHVTICESPSLIDEVSIFLYEEDLRKKLKTPENVRTLESETPLNLMPSSYLNMPSTSFSTPEDIRPFPKAKSRINTKTNFRKSRSTIYTDTPEKENPMERKRTREQTSNKRKNDNPMLLINTKKKSKNSKKNKDNGKGKGKDKGKTNEKDYAKNSNYADDSDYSESDNTICLECTESYADSI